MIGPGILVAATGVGAGDLATGALTGSKLGLAVLWAAAVGAGLKYVLTEGLARWQLATGETLLEGCVHHFGRPAKAFFLVYLLMWSFLVGSALMSACGVAAHAILPLFEAKTDKIVYGLLHSAAALVLVRRGGYRLFARVMGVCIGLMFVVVVATAAALTPSWSEVGLGLVRPTIPAAGGQGLAWTVALMGGVGGTLTVLCYGYWIREEGRHGPEAIRTCRIDLATAYAMTALFGVSMVIIGNTIDVQGGGATLIVDLANKMATASEFGAMGPAVKWAFLAGAWGAVFSSLLGVWQSVPYIFADFWSLARNGGEPAGQRVVDTGSRPYRAYLYGLAIIPAAGLIGVGFARIQLVYAIFGATFMPVLALALLILNGRSAWVGERFRNSWFTSALLLATLVFFLMAGWMAIRARL